MEQKKVTMTKDQIIVELMELLKQNSREKQANEIYELSAYVESLENKLDVMTSEFVRMSKELSELKMLNASPTIRESLVVSMQKANSRIRDMREKITEIKTDMRRSAGAICVEFKKKGKEALNKVSEFFGIKEKLETMRDSLREGIKETERTLARIEGFEEGIKAANHQLANSFRVLAGKETKDFSKKEFFKNNAVLIKKPWLWQKNVYQNLLPFFDAAIERLDKISSNIQVSKMICRWDEMYVKTHETPEINQIEKTVLASEKQPMYGAEAFDMYIEQNAKKFESEKILDAVNVKEKGYSF